MSCLVLQLATNQEAAWLSSESSVKTETPFILNPSSTSNDLLSSRIVELEGALSNVTIERDALATEVQRLKSNLGAATAAVRRSDNKEGSRKSVGERKGGGGEGGGGKGVEENEGGSEWGMLEDRPELWRQRTFQPHGPYGFVKYR